VTISLEFIKTPGDWLEPDPKPARKAPASNCPGCGRFAKCLRTVHYYNGSWNCIRIEVRCTQCGDQGIECV
jgi:hypothetical protein